MTLAWTSWAVTDVGTVRAANEDAFVDRPANRVWAVADGAGGHDHGEVAANALKAALEAPLDGSGADLVAEIRTRVAAVHETMRARAAAEQERTGRPVTIASTLVVLMAMNEHFACLWCGDSRAYLLRGGHMVQISRDHSLVQELVDSGALAAEAAERHPHANVLTRAIGADGADPELEKITGRAEPGDRFLLCSDGLFKVLDPTAIAAAAAGPDPARTLIDAALRGAARDNVTAVVIEATPVQAGAEGIELAWVRDPILGDVPDPPDPDATLLARPG